MPANKVLIPLDGSTFSRQILLQVRQFLTTSDNELVLFRVAPLPHGMTAKPTQPVAAEWPQPMHVSRHDLELAKHPIYASQMQDSLIAQIEEEHEPDLRWLKAAGYTVTIAIRFGTPAQEILKFVAEENVDLLAMTTHGRTGLNRLVLGSVAEQVLHKLPVPIVLFRPIE